jgi:hypothetical protein
MVENTGLEKQSLSFTGSERHQVECTPGIVFANMQSPAEPQKGHVFQE